jgi:hypothetical protein
MDSTDEIFERYRKRSAETFAEYDRNVAEINKRYDDEVAKIEREFHRNVRVSLAALAVFFAFLALLIVAVR